MGPEKGNDGVPPAGRQGDGISRRGFLSAGLTAVAAACFPVKAALAAQRIFAPSRALAFYNIHTGESLETCYWREGRYMPGALEEIDFILRDHRTGEVKPMDRGLVDLLHSLKLAVGTEEPFHVISGYRSPATNAALRRRGGGVAKASLHLTGEAADIRLPRFGLAFLRNEALRLGRGGVGYYPKSGFVHVDVGRVRRWSG